MSTVFYEQRKENPFAGKICDHPFPSHVHDVVEIVCLLEGSVSMTIDGKRLTLFPGDIAIAFPVVPHSYDEVSEDASGLSLIFQPDTIMEFYHTFRTMQPVYPLLLGQDKAPELEQIIRAMLKVMAQGQSAPLKLGYLHLFLSYLFSCLPLTSGGRNPHSTLTYQVLQYISEHFT